MSTRQPMSEKRIQELLDSFEWWLRQGPDRSQVAYTQHNGSVWCKGIEYNGPGEEVPRILVQGEAAAQLFGGEVLGEGSSERS